MLEVLHLGVALQRSLDRLVKPSCQQDAAVGGGERVIFPFRQVLVLVEPLVQQLAEVNLDMLPQPAVNRVASCRSRSAAACDL